MSKKKEKKIDLNNLEPGEKLKYEVAEELGLLDRVLENGWKSLTSKETGRIGGIVTRERKNSQAETRIGKTLQKQVNLVKLYGW